MIREVKINGFQFYADINNQILYQDKEKKSGTPFSFLSQSEREQMEKELRFPRKKKEDED